MEWVPIDSCLEHPMVCSVASKKGALSAEKRKIRTSISATSNDLGRKTRHNAIKMDTLLVVLIDVLIYAFHASGQDSGRVLTRTLG